MLKALPLLLFVTLMTLGGLVPVLLEVLTQVPQGGLSVGALFQNFGVLFSTPGIGESVAYTLAVSLTSSVLAALSGILLAWGIWRLPDALKPAAGVYRIPLIMPHLAVALLVLLVWAPSGLVSSVLHALGLVKNSGEFSQVLYGGWGGGIVLAYWFKETPFVVLLVLSALSQMDRRLLLTAQNLGGRPWQTFRGLAWPVIRPQAQTAFLIVFLYSTGSFEIPFILGESRPSMVSLQLYHRLFDKNIGERPAAMAFLLLFFVFCLVFLVFYLRSTGRPDYQGRKL